MTRTISTVIEKIRRADFGPELSVCLLLGIAAYLWGCAAVGSAVPPSFLGPVLTLLTQPWLVPGNLPHFTQRGDGNGERHARFRDGIRSLIPAQVNFAAMAFATSRAVVPDEAVEGSGTDEIAGRASSTIKTQGRSDGREISWQAFEKDREVKDTLRLNHKRNLSVAVA
jgi:hypothetical protein